MKVVPVEGNRKIDALNAIATSYVDGGMMRAHEFIEILGKIHEALNELVCQADELTALKMLEPGLLALANFIKCRELGMHPDYYTSTDEQKKLAQAMYNEMRPL